MLRRLLFAALLAICFDVAVPFEPAAHGALVWEDDEEEAVRAEQRREMAATAQRTPSPGREVVAGRALLAMRPRAPRARRRIRLVRPVRPAAPPARSPSPEDH